MRQPIPHEATRPCRASGATCNAAKPRRFLLMLIVAMTCTASAQVVDGDGDADAASPRELIDRLVREREASPVVPSETVPQRVAVPERVGMPAPSVDLDPAVIGVVPGQPLPTLRREGEFVVERPGRLVPVEDGLYQVFVFDEVAGLPPLRPMVLHKCQRLATMQEAVRQRGEDLLFTLTGEVTMYRDVNYLLPTRIAGTRSLQAAPGSAPDPAPGSRPAPGITPDADPASGPVDAAADPPRPPTPRPPSPTLGPDADARDVMDALFEERSPTPQRPDPPTGGAANQPLRDALTGTGPDASQPDHDTPLLREGEYLVSRAGRLIRGPGVSGVLFSFEADAAESPEAPLILMPCRLLELMEDTVAESGDATVFLLTGRVYAYHGANYLMPKLMRQRLDTGNLR